jgi:hypothetical protein
MSRSLAVARHRLCQLFPVLPTRDAFHKRRLRLAGSIEALTVIPSVIVIRPRSGTLSPVGAQG